MVYVYGYPTASIQPHLLFYGRKGVLLRVVVWKTNDARYKFRGSGVIHTLERS